jgi:hypothetical protein
MEDIMQHAERVWLTRKQAAEYMGVTPGTLAVWDCIKRYDLKPRRKGKLVRYLRTDLDDFINDRLKAE